MEVIFVLTSVTSKRLCPLPITLFLYFLRVWVVTVFSEKNCPILFDF